MGDRGCKDDSSFTWKVDFHVIDYFDHTDDSILQPGPDRREVNGELPRWVKNEAGVIKSSQKTRRCIWDLR